MRRSGITRLLTPLCALTAVLAPAAVHCIAGEQDDFLQTHGRLLTEERRQANVRRQLSGVVSRIDLLMTDLASNDLFLEGGGKRVTELNTALAAVNTNHVPKAEEHLKLARQEPADTLRHIENADRETGIVVRDLDGLLKDMGLTLTEDVLLAQLRSIIKTEELLRRETGEWGKRLYVDPKSAGPAQIKLVQAQHAVFKQAEIFLKRLLEAAGEETDPALRRRFGAAVAAFQNGQPEAAMQEAAKEIEAGRPIGGVERQDLALKALRAAAEALAGQITDDMATVRDVMEHLRQILKAQQQLQQEVKHANTQQFQERHLPMQGRQIEIGQDLLLCGKQAARTMAAFAVKKAQEAMKEAQNSLGANRQEPAVAQQEEAIVNLQAAIEALNALILIPAVALTEAPEYPWKVKVLALDSEMGDPEELKELGKPMSPKIVDMGDVIESGPGGNAPIPGAPSPMPANPSGAPPSQTENGAAELRGEAVALSQMQINALDRRQRAAVFQNYVNRLPKEFRQQVSDYYEALAE